MKAVVVYESMYGNTHLVAEAIGAGIVDAADADVSVVPVGEVSASVLADADLLVVGGPTHVHTLSRASTRKAAVADAAKPERGLTLDPGSEGDGLREWFDGLDDLDVAAAAFDTRLDAPVAFTGRASKGIAKRLRKHGCAVIVDPMSFLVTKENHLLDQEESNAREWGALVVAQHRGRRADAPTK